MVESKYLSDLVSTFIVWNQVKIALKTEVCISVDDFNEIFISDSLVEYLIILVDKIGREFIDFFS